MAKPQRRKPAQFDDRMTLVEHLDELRSRIIFSGIFLVLAIAGCFVFEDTILEIANEPLPSGFMPITLSPQEPFFTTVKLSFYGGILISLPILLYQAYAFVLPAFAPGERKLVLPFLLSVPVLFIGGAFFAYFVVMPAALDFLLGFNADSFNIELRALRVLRLLHPHADRGRVSLPDPSRRARRLPPGNHHARDSSPPTAATPSLSSPSRRCSCPERTRSR